MTNIKIDLYVKLEMLSKAIKEQNNLKPSKSRLDATLFNGEYRDIVKPFENAKGMLFLNLTPQKDFVKAKEERLTEFSLTGKSMNFSGLYFEEIENPYFCYGYPLGKPMLSNGTPNPSFVFRNDLYLFIVNDTYTEVEVLVFRNAKNYASDYLQLLCNGEFDTQIEEQRKKAKPFYNYGIYPIS
jgi:hypothetical protein